MQDGCKVYMDSYMASNRSCFMVTLIIFRNHLLEVGLTQNWESMALQMLIIVMRTRMNRNSLKYHLVEGPITYDFALHLRIRDHITWFWKCLGIAFGHFLLGTHNIMVMALGSCV